ncbi:type II toxin-antitoxin system RelE/ParE family toxin [Rhodoferax saidenbachensis]|uniref:Plasmid stabilization system protein ParE n=1 Tax=Rhodoferax saidenbachensis TaxID=1484693 RepID=A0ABU1ZQ20_9BURK|nr:type II toxin-antitoxin system RelE/ParE family toxin [Rhodoferax saidenbachensis]MDR7307648.1 plasmid stabilization system protein ParE [Rhodoferax saidenbachensis]
MTVRLLAPAQAELDEAIAWYAEQAPGLGETFLIETLKAIQLIEQHPQAWHPLTMYIRRCRLRRFPYSVVYTQDGTDILVLAIAHQHRKPLYWKTRLN